VLQGGTIRSGLCSGRLQKMPSNDYHLAEINVARLIAPIDDPRIAGFVAQLDPINQLADQSDGFVWPAD